MQLADGKSLHLHLRRVGYCLKRPSANIPSRHNPKSQSRTDPQLRQPSPVDLLTESGQLKTPSDKRLPSHSPANAPYPAHVDQLQLKSRQGQVLQDSARQGRRNVDKQQRHPVPSHQRGQQWLFLTCSGISINPRATLQDHWRPFFPTRNAENFPLTDQHRHLAR